MNETSGRDSQRITIRRLMRERRRQLSDSERRSAAAAVRDRLLALSRFRHARNIAAYLAVDGEMPLDPVIETAWSLNIPVYLPCLRGQRMEFRCYAPSTPLRENRFGIPEPETGARISTRFLDIVLTPLTAFDTDGGRLGTGGGYYDRTFAFLLGRHAWQRPALLGIAYEFQQTAPLPLAAWDVPLHGVVTDMQTHYFRIRGRTT
ncbi:MAG TPA: 5-formyltetrahydrofolate cyclo-ligase [Gammaproteobacteria bacterium]